MFETHYTNGKDIPYCQVWVGSRTGKPTLLGDSLSGTGIFKPRDPAERSVTTVNIQIESGKPNSATLNLFDYTGILEKGIHQGVDLFIKLGYSSNPGTLSGFGLPQSKLVFAGVMEKPSVSFEKDGTIKLSIKAEDKSNKLSLKKKSVNYANMPRAAILWQIITPYLSSGDFNGFTCIFKSMAEVEKKISQVKMSDLEFIYYLAKKWGCTFDTRIDEKTNMMVLYFVDSGEDGNKVLSAMDPSLLLNAGKTVYRMEWQSGIKNVVSLNFSGSRGKSGEAGVIQRKEDGSQEIVKTADVAALDPDDPSNWVISDKKVYDYAMKHDTTVADVMLIANTWTQAERHKAFYDPKNPGISGTPIADKDSAGAGLGKGGGECAFELAAGDPFLCANTAVSLEGDNLYGMFKSDLKQSPINAVDKVTKRIWTNSSPLYYYWRTQSVDHNFGPGGFVTKGKLVR